MTNLSANMLGSNIKNLTQKEKEFLAFLMFMSPEIKEVERKGNFNFLGFDANITYEVQEMHYQQFLENGYEEDFELILDVFSSLINKTITLKSDSCTSWMTIFNTGSYNNDQKIISFKFNDTFLREIENNSFKKKE